MELKMLKNYLKTAFRFMLKDRAPAFINILGLAVGMTACLLILHYILFETSYDRFHPDGDRIYRLRYERTTKDGTSVRFASCAPPAGDVIRERIPEVEKLARIFHYQASVSRENTVFYENRIFFMEPEFFDLFRFRFISGNPAADLDEIGNAFVSETTARKYFGDDNPLGRTISIDKKRDYRIAGVFQDCPANSHIRFDFVLPMKDLAAMYGDSYMLAWGHTGMYTYLKIKSGTDMNLLKRKIADLVQSEFGETLAYYEMTAELPLQPLHDIHLDSQYMQEYESGGSRNAVQYLSIIAGFIIVMAWVNYMSLTVSRSLTRAREVGIRKALGATRAQVRARFFLEILLTNILAGILAMALLAACQGPFHRFTGMPADFSIFTQPVIWISFFLLMTAGGGISGFYPVMTLSSFHTASVIHGKKAGNPGRGEKFRRALMVFQYIIALVLLVATLTIYRQLSHLSRLNPGFEMDQTLVIRSPRVRPENQESVFRQFKNELLSQSGIHRVCHATEVPGRPLYWDAGGIMRAGEDQGRGKNYLIVGVDADFRDFFGLELAAGQFFNESSGTNDQSIMMNETAVRWMGFASSEAAVGQQIDYWGRLFTVIGVLKDYHQQSPKTSYKPQLFRYMPTGRDIRGVFAVRMDAKRIHDTAGTVERLYRRFFPGNPFEAFFLDDYYDQQYRSDRMFGAIFRSFAALAVFINVLGLFALSSFAAVQRTREVGIRKVLGATVPGIYVMMIREYVGWLWIAALIACPAAWYAMTRWLENFSSRIAVTWWIFMWAVAMVLGVAVLTVTGQVLKAARSNPVKSLRYE